MAAQLVLQILLDGVMAMLLIVTTAYCWRLNKRIRILQDSKSELAQIIRDFDESTQRATQSIAEIHGATSRIAENIQHKIDKANYLADDLQFMIEKGNKLADKMEGTISPGRAPVRAVAPARESKPESVLTPIDEEKIRPATQARRGEVRAEIKVLSRDQVVEKQASVSGGDKAKASLESMLRKVSGRNERAGDAAANPADLRRRVPGARLRSRAEQELFDALKAGGDKA